jgi:hypothetical protein
MLVPESPYQPVFDFLCDNERSFDLMQVTIAKTHPIRGVNVLKSVLSKASPKDKPSRFIFVVPDKHFESFKLQQEILTTKDQPPSTAIPLEQFALCVEIPEIITSFNKL